MAPLVTFVVPCYKHAHLLPQCVNSILEQDYKDFEVLIMDNDSPDDTPEVAQSFGDRRVRHIRNESNLGHIRNFNKGISLAAGKYVWIVMADDTLRSARVLGQYVDLMEANPFVGFVFCRAMELGGQNETGLVQWADCGEEDRIWKDSTFFLRLIEQNCIVASTVLVRKECYGKLGLFEPDLLYACDWFMWCLLALHYGVAYLSEPSVCCRVHAESMTTLNFQEYARNCVADELSVLWRIGRRAGLEHRVSIQNACQAALVGRATWLLRAGLKGVTPCMSEAEFDEILKRRIDKPRDRKWIRGAVYANLADQQNRAGELPEAAHSYWLALMARPWPLKTWKRYLFLRSAAAGMRIRRLSHWG